MSTGLEALRDLILDDPVVAEDLDVDDAGTFAARAVERLTGLDEDQVRLAVQTASVPPAQRAEAPPGWLPVEVLDGRAVRWRWFGRRRLVEPFYADSAMMIGYRPLNRFTALRTPLPDRPGRTPDGLVFHMSRCGSTLAAQMLAASPANVVIAEAAPLDAVLRLPLSDEAKVHALRAMAAALGQARDGETRLFLKLDCWHTRDLPLFRRAFPDTPWVFLYREPTEVLVSHLRRRGVQMIPELLPPARLGLAEPEVPNADYCARVLAAICQGAADHHDADGLLVNYRELPGALTDRILPHFGLTSSPDELALIRAAAARDAKAPDRAFTPDGEAKQREAGEDVRAICEHRIGEAYRRLEAMRTA